MQKGTPQFQRACADLFSPDLARDPAFLDTLNPGMLRQAFRKKARQYHPDLHRQDSVDLSHHRRERFIRIRESYEYLSLRVRDSSPATAPYTRPHHRRKRPLVIAVGGAKGGIGKSLFAANLAVLLAGQGIHTVAVDLDLGGANLHLYLGKPRLCRTVNDFLQKKADTLDRVMEKTVYGPFLIGGNSSCLGAGNIGFARKLKLMRAIRHMDADVVVADLGGDTAFNVLDFFLSADVGLVMTTCEPAAYLDAYAFIKTALYRKLNRIFGPESFYKGPVDPVLRRLIQEASLAAGSSEGQTIPALRHVIRKKARSGLGVLDRILNHYRPFILVNRAESKRQAQPPVRRIREVCRKSLSIDIPYLGALPSEPGMRLSARTLVPFVTTPESRGFSKRLKQIADSILSAGSGH